MQKYKLFSEEMEAINHFHDEAKSAKNHADSITDDKSELKRKEMLKHHANMYNFHEGLERHHEKMKEECKKDDSFGHDYHDCSKKMHTTQKDLHREAAEKYHD